MPFTLWRSNHPADHAQNTLSQLAVKGIRNMVLSQKPSSPTLCDNIRTMRSCWLLVGILSCAFVGLLGGCLGSHFVMHMTLGMQGPFTYEALSPAEIVFRPLKQTREFNAAELLQVGSLLATKYLL